MILGTLVDELHRRQLRYGMATLCVGGGMGIDAFSQRCDELAGKFGPGFVLTDEVKATIRQHQPVY